MVVDQIIIAISGDTEDKLIILLENFVIDRIIIIDESSMVPAASVDCIDRLIKDIMKCLDPVYGHIMQKI